MDQRRDVGAALALTFVSGCVDAVSFLGLGGVFVANMTGNVAIVGFAAMSEDLGQGVRAGLSLLCFAVGAVVGGRLSSTRWARARRSGSLHRLLVLHVLLLAAAALLLVVGGERAAVDGAVRYAVIAVVSLAMGLQGAAARHLAVADVPTTAVTTTLTVLLVDSRLAGGAGTRWQRRAAAVAALLVGAVAGGLLATQLSLATAAALALLVAGGVLTARLLHTRAARRTVG